MNQGDAEPTSRADDPRHGGDRSVEVVDVHECHLAHSTVEGPTVPPVIGSGYVRRPVGDAKRFSRLLDLGCFDQPARQIDRHDLGASSGKLT
jgi:hypothetical protein